MSDNPIITFDHVSKDYILYKSDKARFKALFFKPRNPKIHRCNYLWYCRSFTQQKAPYGWTCKNR